MGEHENARPQPLPERAVPNFLEVRMRIDHFGQQPTFYIDTTMLRSRSTCFAAIMTEPGAMAHVTLNDIRPEIFRYYISCACTNNATLEHTEHAPPAEDNAGRTSDRIMMKHCKGYLLARRLGDCTTANLIIDSLIDHSVQAACAFGDKNLHEIYGHTGSESPLRKLAVDLWTFAVRRTNVTAWDMKDLPREFAIDVLKRTMEVQEQAPGETIAEAFAHGFIAREKWRYHDHDELCPRPAGRE